MNTKQPLPLLMSLNGGYVDTAGFLALHGLFTAHVTGNFVTLGAAIVHGSSGALTKLLALPVFCATVIALRLLSYALQKRGLPVLRTMLMLKCLLLSVAAVLALALGPFADGDGWGPMLTGMTLVTAMAIQNAAHRIHLGTAPPTTLMTGNTTQAMIDLADWLRGLPIETGPAVLTRLRRMSASIAMFAAGCAFAAACYILVGMACFIVPALLGLAAVLLQHKTREGEPASGGLA